ncbi:MAG: dephospho-CoA kinase, partial [Clostridia bacterium]|nr:dephospho-CoA kinase [Clostridia bacterium]
RRIMQRDGLNEADAVRRIDAQRSDDFFRARADYVLENNADPEQLRPAIERILAETGVLRA